MLPARWLTPTEGYSFEAGPTSQTLTVRSKLAEASVAPSRENTTQLTRSVCPERLVTSRAARTSADRGGQLAPRPTSCRSTYGRIPPCR